MKTALTIAGSDSSGGAGIQADIKTMTANGVYATSAITALTAQNTTGVYGILESTPEFLANQLDCVFTDIFPDAVKTGMVSSTALIAAAGLSVAFSVFTVADNLSPDSFPAISWPSLLLAVAVFVGMKWTPLKKLHPIVFILASAVAGILLQL